MRNELNRKKNKISDFFDLYFPSYGHYCSKNYKFSMNFYDSSKNNNRKIGFPFVLAYSASFIKEGSELRKGEGSAYL